MTVVISVVAIIISIKMARFPFKKKLKLSGTFFWITRESIIEPVISGYYVSVCNIGNRTVHLKYLGLAIEKDARRNSFIFLYSQGGNGNRYELKPSEVFEVEYPSEALINTLSKMETNRMIYYFASDTEGGIVKNKYISIGDLLSQLECNNRDDNPF